MLKCCRVEYYVASVLRKRPTSKVRRKLRELREEAAEGLEAVGKITRKDVLRRRRRLKAHLERALDRL